MLMKAFLSAALLAALPMNSAHAGEVMTGGMSLDDYFAVLSINEVALSSDGAFLLLALGQANCVRGSSKDWSGSVYIDDLRDRSPPKPINLIGRQFQWLTGRAALVYLSEAGGFSQVHELDLQTGATRAVTPGKLNVVKFRFSADGSRLAYLTRPPVGDPLPNPFRVEGAGILADLDNISMYDFVTSMQREAPSAEGAELWLAKASGQALGRLEIPGDVVSFEISSRGDYVSVVYAPNVGNMLDREVTSLGIYSDLTKKLKVIGHGRARTKGSPGVRYAGGEWLPNSTSFLLRVSHETDPWASSRFRRLLIGNASDMIDRYIDLGEVEALDSSRFFPLNESRTLVETNYRGRSTLLGSATSSGPRDLYPLGGSRSKFSISADGKTQAFVYESLSEAPEVFVKTGGEAHRVTSLNASISRRVRFRGQSVQWSARDGHLVHGWLILPSKGNGPWPLVTHIHGGPVAAHLNKFASFFRGWPYPFELMAQRGMAVFIPNYRGTHSYGRAHASFSDQTSAPIDDIVSGIDYLIAHGIADPQRLGMTGHSHGAWLGPLAMTHGARVQVASFAEGFSNLLTQYIMMPSRLNKMVHDPLMGAGKSIYEDVTPYIEASPDLRFKGVRAAILFEAGAEALGVQMLGYPKVARTHNLPTEFVVYPKAGHSLTSVGQIRESSERNLDWFSYWLLGIEDPDPRKYGQYERWRTLDRRKVAPLSVEAPPRSSP